ncbi:DNA-binding response regulator [Paenibacillus roseipurpureus]|uniref:DNA-binding response regulator n=1 Tax=Paenibacillus roseopurpureus TaxID=2918901 RepID=A0AA96LL52_9BACL|nr:DNA-binding response regulator [Paenibacillus sp. MBLB1832]WNR43755.1 DNA-binding response regulator [Paenibacillus sp. MBLB1832]
MDFQQEHEAYVSWHQARRSGERLHRLQEGHGHAEKLFLEQLWWPVVGHFQHLHPEYEVKDFQDGTRFLDFAYVRGAHRFAFEIDGFSPHARDIDRGRFGDNLMRQNQLVLDGWKILRFSYDDLTYKKRRCQQLILHMLGRWYGEEAVSVLLTHQEQSILKLAAQSVEPLKTKKVADFLGVRPEAARIWLRRLHAKGMLHPASGEHRVRAYVLNAKAELNWL